MLFNQLCYVLSIPLWKLVFYGGDQRHMLQMWWPVRGWGTPLEREGKSPHLYPALRKGGPNPLFFSVPSLRPPAGWLVARLLLSGDLEQNPGPGKKWPCTLCSIHIKTKSQTSICCNHTTTHWVHLTCTNITPTQYTNTWKCTQHSKHTTQTQPSHSRNNTNQSHPLLPKQLP